MIFLSIILNFGIGLDCDAQINLSRLDSIFNFAVENQAFEGTLLIAQNGDVIFHKSQGFEDVEPVKEIDYKSKFGIASITKMFTAIVILQLIEENKIQLNDNLNKLLPELEIPKAKKITIHHLLLHIAGLPNENNGIYSKQTIPQDFITETIKNQKNRFGKFKYANIDYVLLGLIIEKYDSDSWMNSVRKRILNKASMNNTGFLAFDDYPDNYVKTYSITEDGTKLKDPRFYIENFYAAGSMFSTAEDLLKFDQALYESDLLSQNSKDLMFTSYPEYNYSGYSVWTYTYPYAKSKPRIMERRGSIMGSNSALIRFIDMNRTIIILSNNNKFNPNSFGDLQSLREALIIETSN